MSRYVSTLALAAVLVAPLFGSASAEPLPTLYDVVDNCDVLPVESTTVPGVGLGIGDPTVHLDADDGRTVGLEVLVLLDGVTEAHAAWIFAVVEQPYAEIGVDVVPTYQVVSPGFTSTDTGDLMDEAKALFPGGRVPAAYDLVEVLTSKDITGVQPGTAGEAYCLGGARDDRYAFEVSEAGPPPPPAAARPSVGPTIPAIGGGATAAKITAHEMGHLLGGQHEYATCGEGTTPATAVQDPCTLMINDVALANLHFGTVNGRIVRGYALRYASANDA